MLRVLHKRGSKGFRILRSAETGFVNYQRPAKENPMTTANLTKARSVLDRDGVFDASPTFTSRDEDSGAIRRGLSVSQQDFDDMGRPDQVTVTIEPGDHLASIAPRPEPECRFPCACGTDEEHCSCSHPRPEPVVAPLPSEDRDRLIEVIADHWPRRPSSPRNLLECICDGNTWGAGHLADALIAAGYRLVPKDAPLRVEDIRNLAKTVAHEVLLSGDEQHAALRIEQAIRVGVAWGVSVHPVSPEGDKDMLRRMRALAESWAEADDETVIDHGMTTLTVTNQLGRDLLATLDGTR